MMSDTPRPVAPKPGFTVDLSSQRSPARPKRPKGFAPVVQQTINLSTKTSAPEASAPAAEKAASRRGTEAPRDAPAAPRNRRDDGNRRDAQQSAPSGGTSLADLLDEATLARLRGGA